MNLNRTLDAVPDLWNPRFLVLLVGASVITGVVAGWHAGSTTPLNGIAALGAALLAVFGRLKLNSDVKSTANTVSPSGSSRWPGYLFLGLGLVIALAACVASGEPGWEWAAIAVPFAILVFCHPCAQGLGLLPLFAIPLLFGFVFFDVAVFVGEPSAGGFPAVFAIFLVLIGLTTRRLEAKFRDGESATNQGLLHPAHQPTIAALSTLFFFFGVVSFWPWLGKIYGAGYFWVLVIGVLSPLLYLWGRLKQPHADSPLVALSRFNRLLPYIGLILLVAILLG